MTTMESEIYHTGKHELEAEAEEATFDLAGRDVAIKVIRNGLRQRSGKTWSVTGGRGTAWGWITITAPPARRGPYGSLTEADRYELGHWLGLDGPAHHQGVSIPASTTYRDEYVQRATTGATTVTATPYWD